MRTLGVWDSPSIMYICWSCCGARACAQSAAMAQVDYLKIFVGGLLPTLGLHDLRRWLEKVQQPMPVCIHMVWVGICFLWSVLVLHIDRACVCVRVCVCAGLPPFACTVWCVRACVPNWCHHIRARVASISCLVDLFGSGVVPIICTMFWLWSAFGI